MIKTVKPDANDDESARRRSGRAARRHRAAKVKRAYLGMLQDLAAGAR